MNKIKLIKKNKKIALIEAFKEKGLVDRPDLGCALLVANLRKNGFYVSNLGGQENYFPEILINDAKEIYNYVLKYSKHQNLIKKLDLEDFIKFVLKIELNCFKKYLSNLYQQVYNKNVDIKFLEELDYVFRSIMKIFLLEVKQKNYQLGLLNRFIDKLKDIEPDIICFSLISIDELTKTLRFRIRNELKVKSIVVGGSIFSVLTDGQIIELLKNDSIDFIIRGPGENALIDFVNGKKYSEISGLIYLNKGILMVNNIIEENLEKIPFPEFDNIKFLFKVFNILPFQTARGCSWRKCTFCSHHFSYANRYRFFSMKRISDLLKYYQKQYNCNFYALHDEEIPPERMLRFCDVILKEFPKKIFFDAYARLSEGYNNILLLKKMYKAGFRSLSWGVESGSPRILKLMNKGIDIEIAKQILEKSREAGIKNICWLIAGFPGETKKDFSKTVKFIIKNNKNISFLMISKFELLINTYLYHNSKKFGIKLKKIKYNTPIVPYKVKSGLTSTDAENLIFNLLQKKQKGEIKFTDSEFHLPDFNMSRMIIFKIASTGKI